MVARNRQPVERLDAILVGTVVVLTLFSLGAIGISSFPGRVLAPAVDMMLDTTALVVTSLISVLAWLGFKERKMPFAAYQSAAFLALAIANLRAVVNTIGPDLTAPLVGGEPGQDQLYVFTAARILAATLLVIGGVATLRGHTPRHPRLLIALSFTLMVGFIALVWVAPGQLVDLVTGAPPAVTLTGAAIQIGSALLFAGAAIVCRQLWRRDRSIGDAYLAFGLVLAAFAQLNGAHEASTHPGPVAAGDLLRLTFYVALLLAIEAEARLTLAALQRSNLTLEQLRESEVARAALEERTRLSRELHDGLAQDLWLAKLKVGRLTAFDLAPAAREIATEVAEAVDAGLAEARQAVMALRVAGDADGTFAALMARYVDDFEDRFGLRVDFECAGDLPRLPVRTQAELLRIAQEALTNAHRHADATVVHVRAGVDGDMVRLSVADNGRGFDPATARPRSFGLLSMRERAALIGGELQILSGPGSGTQVVVTAPLVGLSAIGASGIRAWA